MAQKEAYGVILRETSRFSTKSKHLIGSIINQRNILPRNVIFKKNKVAVFDTLQRQTTERNINFFHEKIIPPET